MAQTILSHWFKGVLRAFGGRSELVQVGALPCRMKNKKLQVCLVTSRGTGRWIIPKGWPEPDKSPSEQAGVEAWEEAGLKGDVQSEKFASYTGHKGVAGEEGLSVRMDVYLMIEPTQQKDFPEADERTVQWFSINDAIKEADEDGLKSLLQRLLDEGIPAH